MNGKKLRRIREAMQIRGASVSQGKLAELLGYRNYHTVLNMERGHTKTIPLRVQLAVEKLAEIHSNGAK